MNTARTQRPAVKEIADAEMSNILDLEMFYDLGSTAFDQHPVDCQEVQAINDGGKKGSRNGAKR
jgi:hypothetical protein